MKQINVAVVGLSGVERDKGQVGVGKSCLCNRFVRPLTDDYFIDHISVLSQSDFSGRIVNNDHFLYWGEVKKVSEEGQEYSFQVVEQTEFVDDATFQPFKVGKMEPYYKRCASIRIQSAEKLMYVCKNQLGIEREYEQIVLPDGRLVVDGFVCVFDVSLVPNRSVEKQVEYVHNIIQNLLKTKKPIVLVTTKNDDANDVYVREAEKICQRKEYKNSIILVESSAHESINIDLAFIVLAQMVDKTKNRTKILTYHEAARIRKEMLDQRTEYVSHLIRNQITDYRSIWSSSNKKLLVHKEWQDFLELFGQEAGQRIFRRHIKKLREENSYKKLQRHLSIFANVLQEIIPDLKSSVIEFDTDWNSVRNWFRNNMDFDQYFYENDTGTWADESDDENADGRIPFEVLDTNEAETVFKNHLNILQREQKRLEMPKRWKKQFKKLLEETGYVTPGKQLSEVRVLFMGRECFEALSEHDCQQIYDNHQREIIELAKHNFQELLLEHADLFYHFKSIEPTGTITQNDIKDITDVLQEDLRYKLLDRLDQERKLMLFQHLGFVHCPIREHCPAFPGCIDSLIERIVSSSNQGLPPHNRFQQKDGQMLLNLLIVGLDYVSNELIGKIHLNCNDNGEYIMDGHTYNLNIETINRENDSFSFDLHSKGLVCVFSNRSSFQYIVDTIEKQILENVEFKEEIDSFHIILVNDVCKSEEKIDLNAVNDLREDAQQLAERLGCLYIDGNDYNSIISQQNQERFIDSILNSLIEIIPAEELKYRDMYNSDLPDIRIILSMFCGDPYSVDNIINALMSESSCVSSGDRHITFELFLGDNKRRVEVILSSYHGANAFRDELVHGFILLYSTKRKASLATLNAFSMNIPNLPMQIVSITEPGGVNSFFNNEVCQILITEGNSLADKLHAHFATSSDEDNQFKFAAFAPFLKEVWDKKPEIEHAFHMEEPLTIDSGEGTMEHSIHHHVQPPQPPPRFESYMPNGTFRQQREKNSSTYSRGDEGTNGSALFPNMYLYEDNANDFEKDDRSRGLHLHKGFQMFEEASTPPEPAPPDHHLLTPSSILRQLKENSTAASQSSLDEINSDASGSKESLNTYDSGWLDDSVLIKKRDYRGRHGEAEDIWRNPTSHRAFTTGRRPTNDLANRKVRPKGPSQTLKQPGKLNLKSFAIVNEAIARMNLGGEASVDRDRKSKLGKKTQSLENAPLAAPENDSEDYEEVHYEQINENYNESLHMFQLASEAQNKTKLRYRREKEQTRYSESESDSSSPERRKPGDIFSKVNRKPQSHKRMRKKRVAIPVQPPTIPMASMGDTPAMMYQKLRNDIVEQDKQLLEDESSIDISPRDTNSPMFGVIPKLGSKDNEREKLLTNQKEKKTWFRDSSDSKKSSSNQADPKQKKKASKMTKGVPIKVAPSFASFKQSENSLVPLFLEKCVQFIEQAGLDSEGIYRVPGNRAHVELLYQKFDEGVDIDIEKLDIPVNAVATALKDFFSKHLPSLFDPDLMNELEEIAGTRSNTASSMNIEVKTDKSCRLISLRNLLSKLPPANFAVLKFIFQHFVRVSENSKLNSMDSKNLAICWWPTLLPIEFTDMLRFESMRPYLEDIVQTMIDQYPFLFCGKEAFVMV